MLLELVVRPICLYCLAIKCAETKLLLPLLPSEEFLIKLRLQGSSKLLQNICPAVFGQEYCACATLIIQKLEHGCPPVRRDNLRALASGLSTVQADKPCSVLLVAGYTV